MQSNASYVIQWRAIQWLKEKGYRLYDLGGADPDKVPTTYHFKSRLCGADPTICTRIGEFTACESLMSRWAVGCGELATSWKGRRKARHRRPVEAGACEET
jgi:lipid II:glycine glycyltransferase (peptidoglycan interpeptide bridge formation enzyme)